MPWWQILLILSIVAAIIGLIVSINVAGDVERGKKVDRGVSGTASRHKITANPIFWTFGMFIVLIFIATVYFIFLYPEGAY